MSNDLDNMPHSENDKSERTWAAFTHLSALSGFIIPLGNLLVPLVIWLLKRHDYVLVDDQGREALNFQISITLYTLVAALLVKLFIGVILLPLLLLFWVVMTIVAAVKSSDGMRFRYPLTLRLIK